MTVSSERCPTWGALPSIAQNTWIEIKGTNLVPANTVAGGVFWSNAPEFAAGQMPTQLGGISAKVNGKPAYVYWFCSATTTSVCASDQMNILTPLDSTVGQVQLVVTNGAASSAPFNLNLQPAVPSFLLFNPKGYPVATHTDANYSLLGPTTLYPGSSTPAHTAETIILWAVGFALPSTPLVQGSATQSGTLPVFPGCTILGSPIPVSTAALVEPGLYALFVKIPDGALNGDNAVSCTYNGVTTPAGDVITVQR